MNEVKYPRLKVFLAFLLCPLVPGFIASIIKTLATIFHLAMNPRLMGEVVGGELMLMPFLGPVLAEAVFLVPFLLFAMVIALMKVKRTSRACSVIALSGAVLATLWVTPFVLAVLSDVKGASFSEEISGMVVLFVTAMATCWLTARFFLPDPAEPSLA
ncbi:hypothetical protein [Pseudomonas sp. HS6]|uniref:hypothetical protein n=1 Tax=Pseudomonas sp. HS6 TaxID=2850559 RepID=UPI002019B2E1|nr:hypothetical protein [Pseudomonas sp. HS6]UQS16683.1 hypothetical protein JJN09_07460 [Pseudomonas sp. HS6]